MPKQSLAEKSIYWLKVISLGLILGLGIQFAEAAWTAPTLPPPSGTISGPLTKGDVAQYKTGKLGVNSITTPINALEVGGGGNAVIGGSIYTGGSIYATGSTSTYGAVTIQGSKGSYNSGGWSGINFKDNTGVNAGTLIMHKDYSGFFNAADNNWRWLVDNSGNSWQGGVSRATDFCSTVTGRCLNQASGARTWGDYTTQRTMGTGYTNETDHDIEISVGTYSGVAYTRCSTKIMVNQGYGNVMLDSNFVNNSIGAALCSASATIPSGAYYWVDNNMTPAASVGENEKAFWSELR